MARKHSADGKVPAHRGRSSLMNIGLRLDYAVRALSYLAGQKAHGRVSRATLGHEQGIPANALSKIMRSLVVANLVSSLPGPKGGFLLTRSADSVSLKEVFEAVEGPIRLIDCLTEKEKYCKYHAVCYQAAVWKNAQNILENYLRRVILADIADATGLASRAARMKQIQRARDRGRP